MVMGWLLRGSTASMASISMMVRATIRANAARHPKVSAIHVPMGTPTTEAMENPENTHAMNRVRLAALATSGA